MTDSDGHRMTIPPARWLLAGGLVAALVASIAVGTTLGGGSDDASDHPAASAVDQPLTGGTAPAADSEATPRDVSNVTTDALVDPGRATTSPAPPTTISGPRSTPGPTPLTWQQQVAANPTAPIRLNPLASDWTVEQLIIGKDLAGHFLGRVNVRYSGPGSATGKFEVVLLKDGKDIGKLVGETAGEVRAGVYPVILSTDTSYVDGPWATQFRVVSTS